MSAAVVLFLGLLLPWAVLWIVMIWGRPAIARARVEREVLLVRDRVMDGILSGAIDRDDPRAQDILRYCQFLADHSREISLSVSVAVAMGMRQAGVDVSKQAAERAAARVSARCATEGGRRRLEEAERELDHILARYLVHGSSLWWALAPAQRLYRYLQRRKVVSRKNVSHVVQPPGDLATEMREAARGRSQPPSLWTVHGLPA